MDLTTGSQLADAIIGVLILISGGGGVMKLKRAGLVSFGRGNGNPNTFTRKEFMSKESKKAIEKLQEDNKLLQTKEMCIVLNGQLQKDVKEIKDDVKLILKKV